MTMKRPYQITSIVFLLFSAFMARESLELKFYTTLGPGPGFFPFWLSVIFAILAGFQFYHATWGRSDPMPDDFFASRTGYLRALAVVVAMAGATVLMERIGFRFTMLAFLLFLLVTLGRGVNWITIALISLVGSLGTFYVFDHVLKVPLPVGPLDEIFNPLFNLFGS